MRRWLLVVGTGAVVVGLAVEGCGTPPPGNESGGNGGESGGDGDAGQVFPPADGGLLDAGQPTDSGTGGTDGGTTQDAGYRELDPTLTWYGTNRARLDDMIASLGNRSASYDSTKKPVAVFDLDDTVTKNSIGDATFFWMLKNNKILQPPAGNWRRTSPFLTSAAQTALELACPTSLAPAGSALPTGTNNTCASEILNVYANARTTLGAAAFLGYDYRRMEPTYAWAAQLQAGWTFAEAKGFADTAATENLAASQGATQTIGAVPVAAWIRIYDQMRDLIGTLQANGFDVWAVSASSQTDVEAAANRVGIAADHAIGIRMVEASGKLTYDIIGCADIPDGTNNGAGTFTGNSLIPYIDGTRCWINKVVYGVSGATALTKTADTTKRQAFAAGDSDTDATFLKDATVLKLVLNRNRKELMCNAYGNAGAKWLINPMFIDPRPKLAVGYPCSSTGCKDSTGASVPCRDENDQVIADQQDTVF